VVTEFLRYARPLDISAETVALAPLVDRAVAEIRELFPQVAIHADGEFGEVAGDDGLLRQALLNLVRNAAEASLVSSGRPWVAVRGEVSGAVSELSQRILVQDNGPGIAPEALPKLFLPFFTTKANGTGLGLAIVQKILLQHGGQIAAQNRAPGGAEFIVSLPAIRRVPEAVESKEVAI
jgi:signal transduction histidine kinase